MSETTPTLSREDELATALWAHQQVKALEKARTKAVSTALKRIHKKYDAKRAELIAGLPPSVSAEFSPPAEEEIPVTLASESE